MKLLIEKIRQRLGEHLWRTLVQFFIFGLIGGSGVFVDTAVVVFFREMWVIDERIAAIPAFVIAVTWNYELNHRITFKKEVEDESVSRKFSYISFVLIGILALGIRILTMHILIEYFYMTHENMLFGVIRMSYVASFIGIFIASVINFLGSKFIAFRGKKNDEL